MTGAPVPEEQHARALDEADKLAPFRDEFLIPPHGNEQQIYLCEIGRAHV